MENVNIDTNRILTNIVEDLAKSTGQKIKNFLEDRKIKEDIDFGYIFENYLIYSKENNEKVKTLLYRHSPKDLYSFYESVSVKNPEGKSVSTNDVNNLLDIGHKIIISGTGGIGKSMLMKHLFLDCIKNTRLVPVLIELRGLNELNENMVDLSQWLLEVLENNKLKLGKTYFEYSLEIGSYLILFDGYDEVKSAISDKVAREIMKFCNKYPENYYIISSRPLEEFMGWNNFIELKTETLTKEQAISLINKLDYDINIKKVFVKALEDGWYEKYKSFASNPLLLTIMLLTFENRVSIPERLNDFYSEAFSVLFHAHDASKGAYRRDIASGLSYEDFKIVFACFCFKSFIKSEYEFSRDSALKYIQLAKEKVALKKDFSCEAFLTDLTNSVCMLVKEGLTYKFSHRSFQEYFAAIYTTKLNDETQKQFLSGWIGREDSIVYRLEGYLDILYDLQEERFINNYIIEGLLNIEKDIQDSQKQLEDWIFSNLYICVFSKKFEFDDKEIYRFGLYPNSKYFKDVIDRYFDYVVDDISLCDVSEEEKNLRDIFSDRFLKGYLDEFDENGICIKDLNELDDELFEILKKTFAVECRKIKLAIEYLNDFRTLSDQNNSFDDFMSNL